MAPGAPIRKKCGLAQGSRAFFGMAGPLKRMAIEQKMRARTGVAHVLRCGWASQAHGPGAENVCSRRGRARSSVWLGLISIGFTTVFYPFFLL